MSGVKVGRRPAQRNLDARQREISSSMADPAESRISHGEQSGAHWTVSGAANKLAALRAKRPECGAAFGAGSVAAQSS